MKYQSLDKIIEEGAGFAACAAVISDDMDRVVHVLSCIQEIAAASPDDCRASLDRIEALSCLAAVQLAAMVSELDRLVGSQMAVENPLSVGLR